MCTLLRLTWWVLCRLVYWSMSIWSKTYFETIGISTLLIAYRVANYWRWPPSWRRFRNGVEFSARDIVTSRLLTWRHLGKVDSLSAPSFIVIDRILCKCWTTHSGKQAQGRKWYPVMNAKHGLLVNLWSWWIVRLSEMLRHLRVPQYRGTTPVVTLKCDVCITNVELKLTRPK